MKHPRSITLTIVTLLALSPAAAGAQEMLKDINPGPASGSPRTAFVELGGELFFQANDGLTGGELWKSDGTAAGTVLVKDINPGSGSSRALSAGSDINELVYNGELFFEADDGTNGPELWKSKGDGEHDCHP